MEPFSQALYRRKNLLAYLEQLREKHVFSGKLYRIDTDGIALSDILRNQKSFAKALIKDLKHQHYQFGKARIKTIQTQGKERLVYSYTLIDAIVAGYFAHLMNLYLEPLYSPNLYSYRKQRSYWVPVQNFAAYTRHYIKHTPDPKQRGLYVLRRDIKSYTDSIPVHEGAPLWDKLDTVFFKKSPNPYLFGLMKKMIRNTVETPLGDYSMYRGIPTGQPITATLYNFYAMDLDRYFDGLNGFYTRYSDDLIFCAPNRALVKQAIHDSESILSELGLQFNVEKAGNFYFNGAGKPCEDPSFKGSEFIEFLGCRVKFKGTVAIKQARYQRLMREVRRKIRQIQQALPESSLDIRGKNICRSLNHLFWTPQPLENFKSLELLKRAVTDRQQLQRLDYQIARLISQELTGIKSVKTFRILPYRTIRKQWGLKSFEHQRNRYGR